MASIAILVKGDTGAEVQLVKYVLQLLGYNPGQVNDVFDDMTLNAIKQFQSDFGLIDDGKVGPETYSALKPYLFGFREYIVMIGEDLKKISSKFKTTPKAIEIANPKIDTSQLRVGTKLIIPYGFDVVKTNVKYTHYVLSYDINGLKARYPFLYVDVIGKSVNQKEIFRIRLGEGSNKVTYNSSHHANEWITTPVIMKWVEEFLKAYVSDGKLRDYYIPEIWKQSTIDIIPMVNPDGVDLVIDGVIPEGKKAEKLIKWNNGSKDFSNWKANINGIDLNRNYNAAWEQYKILEKEFGITGPGPAFYSGETPVSEPEVKAMVEFTKKEDYRLALAYHTQGQIIYWSFMDKEPPESKYIGEQFAEVSGYKLAEARLLRGYAQYKDWFIQEFYRPGYMIECGKGNAPLPLDQFGMIYDNNEELLLLASVI